MLTAKKSLLVIGLLLLTASVTALTVQKTEFVIATDPYLNISVSVIDEDTNEEVELFEGRARKFGEFRFTYYGTIDRVRLEVRAINNETGETIKEETFGPYSLGTQLVNLNFTLGELAKSPVEEEIPETTSTTEEGAQESNSITGLAIDETSSGINNIYFYVAAAILAAAVIVIVARKHMSVSTSSPVEPNPKKIMKASKVIPAKKEVVIPATDKANDESINDTEKRIADLQKQLDQVRNEEKLAKLQKQLKLEQQSLKRLQEDNEDKPQQPNNNLDNQSKPF